MKNSNKLKKKSLVQKCHRATMTFRAKNDTREKATKRSKVTPVQNVTRTKIWMGIDLGRN